MKFIEEGTKTNTMAGQGVAYKELLQQVANTKTAYELVGATAPETLTGEAKQEIDKALEGWDLTLRFWRLLIDSDPEDVDSSMEPDVNHYKQFLAYLGDKAVINTFSPNLGSAERHPFGFARDHVGVKYLPFKPNISVFLSISGDCFTKGRTVLLQSIQH